MCLVSNTKLPVLVAEADILVIKELDRYDMSPFTKTPIPDDGKLRNPGMASSNGEPNYQPCPNGMDDPYYWVRDKHEPMYMIGVGFHSYSYDAQGVKAATDCIATDCVAHVACIPKGTRYVTNGQGHYVSEALDVDLKAQLSKNALYNLP